MMTSLAEKSVKVVARRIAAGGDAADDVPEVERRPSRSRPPALNVARRNHLSFINRRYGYKTAPHDSPIRLLTWLASLFSAAQDHFCAPKLVNETDEFL